VCQVRIATSAVIRGWSLNRAAAKQLIQQAVTEIAYHQQRNTQARKSHTKTTQRRLEQLGIDLANIPAVSWDTG
jgi:ABC-type Fe2+-enterobactin transport system substrate-binding protein